MTAHALRRRDSTTPRWPVRLQNGRVVHIRAIDMADVQRERAFLSRLSPETRAYRFLGLIKEANESVARELTEVDPEREVVLGALRDAKSRSASRDISRTPVGNIATAR
jgi:hypothetical protein